MMGMMGKAKMSNILIWKILEVNVVDMGDDGYKMQETVYFVAISMLHLPLQASGPSVPESRPEEDEEAGSYCRNSGQRAFEDSENSKVEAKTNKQMASLPTITGNYPLVT